MLQLLFVLNPLEVIDVVFSITNYALPKVFITFAFLGNVVVFICAAVVLFIKSDSFKINLPIELLFLLVFTIIFKVSTLIWGFTIYFIFWHSIPSLFEQVHFIFGDFNKTNVLLYCKKAIPYWAISLIGISIVYMLFKEEKLFYGIFFSFIAAVTFPHALVINKMFENKKTQSN